jgi:hypothetical protein
LQKRKKNKENNRCGEKPGRKNPAFTMIIRIWMSSKTAKALPGQRLLQPFFAV